MPYFKFQASIKEYKFFEIFENVRKFHSAKRAKVVHQDPSTDFRILTTNSDSQAQIMVDLFIRRPGSDRHNADRIQLDVFGHRAFREHKLDKQFVDLLHRGVAYRVSTCFEHRQHVDIRQLVDLDTSTVDCVRVKSRRSWGFEFMSVDLTTTYSVNQGFRPLKAFCQLVKDYLRATQRRDTPQKSPSPGPNDSESPGLVPVDTGRDGFVGVGRDYTSEFISEMYGFLQHYGVQEQFEVENEVKDVGLLLKALKQNFLSFQQLIGREEARVANKPRQVCADDRGADGQV